MRHDRHYTLDEARALLPRVAELLATMRGARARLTDDQVRQALIDRSAGNGGGAPGKQVGEAFVELRGAAVELETREIVVRDLDRGLVDFPSIIDGREVYLCWVEAEEGDIAYWHDLDAGYGGREPL